MKKILLILTLLSLVFVNNGYCPDIPPSHGRHIKITDEGAYYTSNNVEGALQEVPSLATSTTGWTKTGTLVRLTTDTDNVDIGGDLTLDGGDITVGNTADPNEPFSGYYSVLTLTTNQADTSTALALKGNGTGIGSMYCFDEDNAETINTEIWGGIGYFTTYGTAPGPLYIQPATTSNYGQGVYIGAESASGMNQEFRLYGFPTGGTRDYAKFQIVGANDDLQITTNKAGSDIILSPSGNVGIGMTGPTGKLDIQGLAANDLPTYSAEFLSSTTWTSTGWTGDWATGWIHTVGETNVLSHDKVAVNATKYQIAYTVTNRTEGSFAIGFGGQSLTSITATGAFGPTTISTANLTITPTSDFNGTIVISIKSITAISTPLVNLKSSDGAARIEMRANTASGNTFIGVSAGNYNTTGHNNSAMGLNALQSNTTGFQNSAMGNAALYSNTTGNYNSAMGNAALYNLTEDYHNNTALGLNAGRYQADGAAALTTPSQSVYIGSGARGFSNSDVNSIVIGYNAIGIGANTVVLGNDSITTTALKGKVGINETAPRQELEITDRTALASESLTNGNFTSFTGWTRSGDFAEGTANYVYTHSTGAGTLTQANASLAIKGKNSRQYKFVYTVSAVTKTGALAAAITTAFGDTAVTLDVSSNGIKTVYFASDAACSAADFVISATSNTAGDTFTLDDLSLKEITGGDIIVNGDIICKSIYDTSPEGLVLGMNFNTENITGSAGTEKVLDSSNYNNHGTNAGATHSATTGFNGGGCFNFDGNNDYVDAGDDDSLDITNAMTVGGWVKINSLTSGMRFIVRNWVNNGSFLIYFQSDGKIQFGTISGDGSEDNRLLTGAILITGEWMHIMCVADILSGKKHIYFNGVNVKTQTGLTSDLNINTSNLIIGASSNSMNGSIDEVRIYNRAISADEVKSLYLQRKEILNSYVSQEDIKVDSSGNVGINTETPACKLDVAGKIASRATAVTVATSATTFAITSNLAVVTGDGGGNTVAAITGGVSGQLLTLIFVDALVVITDTDAHTANTVDLSAAFTSADDTTLTLISDGTSWYEVSRSVN